MKRTLDAIARRRTLCCLSAAAFVLVLRASLLPVWPIALPMIHDEFCYLLAADTFAHGRLANPPHPLWQFFETIYVIHQPTYAAKYPPGQGLVMAAGQVLFGHPWYGVWMSCGLLAAALCWALLQWFPGQWALLGTAIVLQLCFFGYWMNSYWGGAVTAIGGALVVGAFPGITNPALPSGTRARAPWLLGLGAVILACCRPFEGLLLLLPVLLALVARTRDRRVWVPILLCGILGGGWLGFYQYRVTGNPFRMPYRVYQQQYETVPQFNFLPVSPEAKTFRHLDQEWVDRGWLLNEYNISRSLRFPLLRLQTWYHTLTVYLGGFILIVPLLGLAPWYLRSRKMRFLAGLFAIIVVGTFLEVAQFAHYPAPFVVVILILTVQSVRWAWLKGGRPLIALALLVLFARTLWNDASLIYQRRTPDRYKSSVWKKSTREAELATTAPGKHVVFVHYTQYKSPHEEWIYNTADIDGQAVIWAQDMGPEENRKLLQYYPGRAFWRFEPDESPDQLIPYR